MKHHVIITGFGPGLSATVAKRLMEQGHRVAGVSRSGGFGETFAKTQPGFAHYVADVSDRAQLQQLIADFSAQTATPSVLIHNASGFLMRDFLETDASDFERNWRTACLGAVHAAQLVLPGMLKAKTGTILFTGATASVRGGAAFSAFASAKFALRGLAQSLARAYGPQGVHVAHVVIDGVIWSERAEKVFKMAREACIDPNAIADTYLNLIAQHPSAWTHELDLRPQAERF